MSVDKKIKSIIITGPTASGKTGISLDVANLCNGEILSCDSMQIYRKMDIGTAKIDEQEQNGVPHHLIDIAEPWEEFSVADYCKVANDCAQELSSRGKTPVFVGGTGLYVTSLVEGFSYKEEDASNEALQAELNLMAGTDTGLKELYSYLQKNDPLAAEKIHINNKKRVVRAVELFKLTGKTQQERNLESKKSGSVLDPIVFAMDMKREYLYARINMRVDLMLELGLVEEVERLLKYCEENGKELSKTALQAIGYKETIKYINGEISLNELSEEIKLATRHYAKRQLTWLRKWPWVKWIKCEDNPFAEIKSHLSENTYYFS
ncbi:MAG: tRNA (adenosine(37)-N6)-dimethylallyltransferase MiaA [Ruminococcaceae bacterium]|nr:tRNA (adenosine(37)-N6)-dimethylallyltransferase MiaA [Oscillospiraceae bacterium]